MCTQCVCVSIYLVKVYWTIFPLLCLAVVFPCQSVNLSWVSQRLTFNIGNIFSLKENYCDPLLRHWGWCREWYIYLKGQACLRPMQDFVPDLQFGWLVGWPPKFPAYNADHHFSCFPLNGYKPTCCAVKYVIILVHSLLSKRNTKNPWLWTHHCIHSIILLLLLPQIQISVTDKQTFF